MTTSAVQEQLARHIQGTAGPGLTTAVVDMNNKTIAEYKKRNITT